jgi:uncharacterized membrane protein
MLRYILLFILVCSVTFASSISLEYVNGTQVEASQIIAIYEDHTEVIFLRDNQIKAQVFEDVPLGISLDLPHTKGRDYSGMYSNTTIILQQIGTIEGIVFDKQANVVPYAKVELTCIGSPILISKKETNRFGFFTFDAPTGSCRINAEADGTTGYKSIVVAHGALQETEIHLNLNQAKTNSNTSPHIFWIIGIFIFIAVVFSFTRRSKTNKKSPLSTSAQNILRTLNNREREIVMIMIDRKELTQAQLKLTTGIPKASLSRLLQQLIMKNILETTDTGNTKRVVLSKWFLEQLGT